MSKDIGPPCWFVKVIWVSQDLAGGFLVVVSVRVSTLLKQST